MPPWWTGCRRRATRFSPAAIIRIQQKRIDTLIALLDAFETMLASDADFALLRRSRRRDLKWRINAFILMIADDVEGLTLALRSGHAHVTPHPHQERRRGTDRRGCTRPIAATSGKRGGRSCFLRHRHQAGAGGFLRHRPGADAGLATRRHRHLRGELDLELFQQRAAAWAGRIDARNWILPSPAMRYGIRLALAMTTGLLLTLAFPRFAHANWVLLTIALIMRANYSITSQRRWDRVTGTLIGCAVAVALIAVSSPAQLLAVIVAGDRSCHAYAGVRYRITAMGASISSLVLLHFSAPLVHPQFFERDGGYADRRRAFLCLQLPLAQLGAQRIARLVQGLLAADKGFADAALRRAHPDQPYRLARKTDFGRGGADCLAPSAAWPTSPTPVAVPWRR